MAITPASGFVAPWASIVIGLLAGVVCYGGVLLKSHFGYDDTLDAFGVHGVGGFAGAILTGVFAQKALNDAGVDGALFGNFRQVLVQLVACAATGVYSAVLTFGILKLIDTTMGLRASEQEEREGLDVTQHGEEAYSESSGGMSPGSSHREASDDAPSGRHRCRAVGASARAMLDDGIHDRRATDFENVVVPGTRHGQPSGIRDAARDLAAQAEGNDVVLIPVHDEDGHMDAGSFAKGVVAIGDDDR